MGAPQCLRHEEWVFVHRFPRAIAASVGLAAALRVMLAATHIHGLILFVAESAEELVRNEIANAPRGAPWLRTYVYSNSFYLTI